MYLKIRKLAMYTMYLQIKKLAMYMMYLQIRKLKKERYLQRQLENEERDNTERTEQNSMIEQDRDTNGDKRHIPRQVIGFDFRKMASGGWEK